MKYTQNEKIMQVTDTTLVVGVDIAKNVHFARAFNYREIGLRKTIKFENSNDGFVKFLLLDKPITKKACFRSCHSWHGAHRSLLVDVRAVFNRKGY